MSGAVTTYGLLIVAILAETFATSSLNASQQFTTFSHVVKVMPVGIGYAIWCALGIVLISVVGVVYFKQQLDLPAYIGLGLIIAGVVVINVFSASVKH